MEKTDVLGKKAFKNKGYRSGIVGIMERNLYDASNSFSLVYIDGTRNWIHNLNEVTFVKEDKEENALDTSL